MCTQQTTSGMSDPALLAGRFLNRYPAMKYVQRPAEDHPGDLNIALVGCAPELKELRNAFFNTIFSSVHMLDTKLHIHILSGDAGEYCRSLQESMPLLSKTTCISLNDQIDGTALDSRVVNEPLAYLDFRTADNDWTTLFSGVFGSWDCGYVLMFDPIFQQPAMKDALSAHFSGKTALLGFEEQAFDGAWHPLPPSPEPDILVQAKKIHTYYSRTFNPRANCESIDSEFKEDYNRNSSIRCALSIPCKLAACRIFTRGKDAAMEFHKKALADTTLLDKLSWLEHRSWQAYMITQGFDLLDSGDTANWDKLYRLPKPKNRIETTALKKHPCLHASAIGSPPINWKTLNTSNLDPLDRISVELYNLCNQRANDLGFRADRQTELIKLRNAVETECPKLLPLLFELEIVMGRMYNREPNINKMWQRLCCELETGLKGTQTAKTHWATLKTGMGIVEARNQRKDYKKIDTELIQAIPYLEIQDSVQTVYKIHSPTVWKNVISSLHIAPRKLYLVILSGDPADDVYQNHKTWCQELLNKRGLTNTTVEVVSINAVTPFQEGSIVDVTGIIAEELMPYLPHFKNSPHLIWHRKDNLSSWEYAQIQFFVRPIDLTVEESIAIFGAHVFADAYEDPLLMLDESEYKALWDTVGVQDTVAANTANSKATYNGCIGVLDNVLTKNSGTCFQMEFNVDEVDVSPPVSKPITITKAGQTAFDLLEIFKQLKRLGIITEYQLTPGDTGFKGTKKTFNKAFAKFINARINTSLPDDKYELVLMPNHLQPSVPKLVLRNTNLAAKLPVNMLDKISTTEMHNFLSELQQRNLIKDLPAYSPTATEITFTFANNAVRSCLIKAGNALEAFAYHTIVNSNLFDDVKLSVNVVWGKSNNTTNEIDVICTKGIHTYMISCKQRDSFEKDTLHEINDHASQFGVCPTTIILTSAPNSRKSKLWTRADDMGVYTIFLEKNAANDYTTLTEALEEIIKETTKTN